MNFEKAVEKSPFGLAFAIVAKGAGARVGNRKRNVWKIDRLIGPEVAKSDNPEMVIKRSTWQPVIEWVAPAGDPVLFKNFELMLNIAGRDAPIDNFAEIQAGKTCELHAGSRGLQTMIKEAQDRIAAIRLNMVSFPEQDGEMDWSNPHLVDVLDSIIDEATKLRELL